MKTIFLVISLFVLSAPTVAADRIYQTPDEFIAQAFAGQTPKAQVLWLSGAIKEKSSEILGHTPNVLRLRYWLSGQRSVWILEEIGKEKPITAGFIVNEKQLEKVKVLIFRESRGWEVKRDEFTAQYQGVALTTDMQLSQSIDGISGATLSVNAINKLSRLALFLHSQVANGK